MDQNHPQSNWQTTMMGNYRYRQGGGFTSYRSALHLGDDLKSRFMLVRLNKSGLKKKMSSLSTHVALMKYGKSCIP